ncbi:C1 family peptidase [Calidithermus chliarophilus]|uniref:C1 family peptidase n=1 Tax=Calidithermus chliarophilus TaxID=52023 RepID=UPI000404AEDA|nr:C1 family peptidase [Calidithermus chliarophilus]
MTRMVLKVFLVGLIGILAACSGGGGDKVFTPDNAFGGPPPPTAQLVGAEEFRRLTQDPDFRWESQSARQARKKQAEDQFGADQVSIQSLVQQRPSLARFLQEPDLSDPSVKKLPGDNYLVTFTDRSGQALSVITMGQHAQLRELLAAHERFMRVDNQLGVYAEAYAALPDDLKAGLPTPQSLQGKGFAEVRAALAALEQKLEGEVEALERQAVPGFVLRQGPGRAAADPYQPPGFPASPGAEERAGEGGDRTGNACDYTAGGLYNNLHWPLKYFITSTKSQGRRGSCTSFALASAAETRVAVREGRWVNLSEQFLYHKIKTVWDADDYDEGAPTADVAEEFSTSGYRLPFEDLWNYNPSPGRAVGSSADEEEDFAGSCTGYDERCSNTTHQGQFLCTQVEGAVYCGSKPPGNGEGYKISSSYVLWENGDDLPLNTIRTMLANGRPMVVALEVTRGMRGNRLDANGFLVDYDDEVLGGHAIHLVGYLSNSKIQAKLPGAPMGGGGGYFILKNSWGQCYGDGGLVYIPVDWAEGYFKNITVFSLTDPAPVFTNKPPTVQITAPADGASFPYAQSVTYTAAASDPDGETPVVTWTSSADGELGSGASLTVHFSSPGPRTVTATARDAQGFTASASIKVTGVNQAPTAQILEPPAGSVYVGSGITFKGKGLDGDGAFPVELPCTSLSWKSSNAGDTLGTGCQFTATFTTTGSRTITLTATDAYGAKGSATVALNVQPLPPSGPPVVEITEPDEDEQFDANANIALLYRVVADPGGGPGSQYTAVWKIKYLNNEQTITPKTCTVTNLSYPCFKPSDYGFNNNGVKITDLTLTVTDPEGLSGSDKVQIQIGFVP